MCQNELPSQQTIRSLVFNRLFTRVPEVAAFERHAQHEQARDLLIRLDIPRSEMSSSTEKGCRQQVDKLVANSSEIGSDRA